MKRAVVIVLLLAAGGAVGAGWWIEHHRRAPRELALYGNVDLRQVQLAFQHDERIAAVLVQEGERVRRGQVVARQETTRIEAQVAQAEAQVEAQRQVVAKLHHGNRPQEIEEARAQVEAQKAVVARLRNGSRPEEIAQARANVEAAKAVAGNARRKYERLRELSAVRMPDRSAARAASQEDVDSAKAAWDEAEAKLTFGRKALELALAGPRREEISEAEAKLALAQQALDMAVAGPRVEEVAQAEAMLRANEAQLAWLKQQLADAQLVAPAEAVVRSRMLEPGEMAGAQRPVLALAIIDPKWVRAYASEADLGRIRPGMAAAVAVDSFPNRRFEGWVGFISPVAEFTPKTVQTEDLRTSLVFEVRVFVKDAADELRLGLPATVWLPLERGGTKLEAGR